MKGWNALAAYIVFCCALVGYILMPRIGIFWLFIASFALMAEALMLARLVYKRDRVLGQKEKPPKTDAAARETGPPIGEAPPPAQRTRAPGVYRLTGVGTILYEKPEAASSKLAWLRDGTVINVLVEAGNFLRVSTADYNVGYIFTPPSRFMTPMTPASNLALHPPTPRVEEEGEVARHPTLAAMRPRPAKPETPPPIGEATPPAQRSQTEEPGAKFRRGSGSSLEGKRRIGVMKLNLRWIGVLLVVGCILMITVGSLFIESPFVEQPSWWMPVFGVAISAVIIRAGLQYDRDIESGQKEEPHFHSNPLFKLFQLIIISMVFFLFVILFFAVLSGILT